MSKKRLTNAERLRSILNSEDPPKIYVSEAYLTLTKEVWETCDPNKTNEAFLDVEARNFAAFDSVRCLYRELEEAIGSNADNAAELSFTDKSSDFKVSFRLKIKHPEALPKIVYLSKCITNSLVHTGHVMSRF
jgi:hypothetical protein